jgi:hypothetical protein
MAIPDQASLVIRHRKLSDLRLITSSVSSIAGHHGSGKWSKATSGQQARSSASGEPMSQEDKAFGDRSLDGNGQNYVSGDDFRRLERPRIGARDEPAKAKRAQGSTYRIGLTSAEVGQMRVADTRIPPCRRKDAIEHRLAVTD